jgi:hypothetical protein
MVRPLLVAAVAFLAVSIGSLAAIVALVVQSGFNGKPPELAALQAIFLVAILAATAGFIFVRSARTTLGTAAGDSLPEDTRRLLGPVIEKSADPIGDWTKLVGLTGGTGVFRKLELSGMPLATILMTILFCLLGLVAPLLPSIFSSTTLTEAAKGPSADAAKIFLDMAKLTLGAFIGSFVTKSTSRDAEATKAGAVAAATAVAKKLPANPPTSLTPTGGTADN